MERIENELLKLRFLQDEHHHRYTYVSQFAKGTVVDCACGIGYSASILLTNPEVKNYYGFDVDRDAISYAQNQNIERAKFDYGSIMSLPFEDQSIDTFISLETLEHLEYPENALIEIKRVLKPDGIFICSVPTESYEAFCSKLYGPNPFHLQSFSLNSLSNLLKKYFQYVDIAIMAQEIVSAIHTLNEEIDNNTDKDLVLLYPDKNKDNTNGSFIAFASNEKEVKHIKSVFTGVSRIEYDEELVAPVRKSLAYAEELALKRWDLLLEAEQRMNELVFYKEQAERISEERLNAILKTEAALQDRDKTLSEAQKKILDLEMKLTKNR
ncbi:hypothetical protein CG428_00640 [Pantoea ananatis]|uniref:class I SAM-dependent methyltransferase n=1 Tax=Pantoea ananas TaxID=553 RepID=UPI000CF3D0A7|nr:class I SAM-dependent methyltransferase [Pantoea ananatis]PQK79913.1 hypothetical protein CG428_00640 [Pantoea ananatis]